MDTTKHNAALLQNRNFYFVQQPLSFLQRVQELSLPAFLSGGNVLKTEMARLMPGLGVLEQHPVQID